MVRRRLLHGATAVAAAHLALVLTGCGRAPYPAPAPEAPPAPPPAAELMGPPPSPPAAPPGPAAAPSALSEPEAAAPAEPTAPPPASVDAKAPVATPPEPERPSARASSVAARRAATVRAAVLKPRAASPARPPATEVVAPAPVEPPEAPAPQSPLPAIAQPAPEDTGATTRTARLAALETALGGTVARRAVLDTPEFAPNQSARVTLTIPADFSQSLAEWAGISQLTDAAATVKLTARLAGEGFTVAPDDVQAHPVVADQANVFEWTVTPHAGHRGPLKAQVGAQLLGAGEDTLLLGTVESRQGRRWPGGLGGRMAGFVALALIAALVAWLFARPRELDSYSRAKAAGGRAN